jgi:hypothetical protein
VNSDEYLGNSWVSVDAKRVGSTVISDIGVNRRLMLGKSSLVSRLDSWRFSSVVGMFSIMHYPTIQLQDACKLTYLDLSELSAQKVLETATG